MSKLTLQTFQVLAKKEAFAQSDDIFYFTLCAEMLTAIPEPVGLKGKAKQDLNKVFNTAIVYCDRNIESITINPDLGKEMTPKAKQAFIRKSKDNFWKLAGNIVEKSGVTISECLFLMQMRFQTMITRTGKIHAQKLYNLSVRASSYFPEFTEDEKLKIVQKHKHAIQNADIELEIID